MIRQLQSAANKQSFDLQLITLRETISETERAVTTKTTDIEEKETRLSALATSLASSESQIQQLTQQLESLAAGSHESEVSELKATIETVTKEKNEAHQLVSGLQTQLDDVTRELSATHEDLKMDRAELDVLRINLADVTAREASTRAEVEAVQDQLHTAVREKTHIENELTDLRSSLADRSTESEAENRNGELVVLQSVLDSARRSAEERERNLEEEMDGLKFVANKDAETARGKIKSLQKQLVKAQDCVHEVQTQLQARISALEADLKVSQTRVQALEAEIASMTEAAKSAPRTSTPDRLGLLYSKIQSLRAERDDLRHSLSFAQNESRFTIRAAEADRVSAIEELEAVKTDLNQQMTVHQSLEQEVLSIRKQLSEKEIKLEEVRMETTGANDKASADRIAHFETEVVSAKAERDHLVQELGESHRQIMELNHAMAMMRTSTDSDKRLRKISMERKVLDMHKITETSTGVALDRGPVEFGARRPGHARTKSEIATLILPDQAQIMGLSAKVSELESEIQMLSGKLERRNGTHTLNLEASTDSIATIAALQLDNEKLNMATELSRESAEEFDELVAERDDLQTQLENLRPELETTTKEIQTHLTRIGELENSLTGLRSEQTTSSSLAEERAAQIIALEAAVQSSLADAASARSLADTHSSTISRLEQQLDQSVAAVTGQSDRMIIGILEQRQRLSQAASAWRKASSQAQHHATALASTKTQVASLTEQVDAFDAERSAMSQQIQIHALRVKSLDSANEKMRELESQVETLEAECAAMSEQLDLVTTREQSLAKQVEEGSATRLLLDEATQRADQAGHELMTAKKEITQLVSEITAIRNTMSATDSAKNELESTLRRELDQAKAEMSASEVRATESAEGLEKLEVQIHEVRASAARDVESRTAELQVLNDTLTSKNEEFSALTERADDLEKQRQDLRAQVEDLIAKVDQAAESATDHTLALQSEKAALEKQLATTSEKAGALRMEVSSTMSKNQRLSQEINTLSVELQNMNSTLVNAQTSVETMTQDMEALEREKEKTVGLLKYQETETMSRYAFLVRLNES